VAVVSPERHWEVPRVSGGVPKGVSSSVPRVAVGVAGWQWCLQSGWGGSQGCQGVSPTVSGLSPGWQLGVHEVAGGVPRMP